MLVLLLLLLRLTPIFSQNVILLSGKHTLSNYALLTNETNIVQSANGLQSGATIACAASTTAFILTGSTQLILQNITISGCSGTVVTASGNSSVTLTNVAATTNTQIIVLSQNAQAFISASNFSKNGNSATNGPIVSLTNSATANAAAIVNISSSTFTSNTGLYGGVIYPIGNTTVTISSCSFVTNTANAGGVVGRVGNPPNEPGIGYGYSGNLYATDMFNLFVDSSNFTSNTATYLGSLYGTGGGAIIAQQTSGIISITNSNFLSHSATGNGGALAFFNTQTLVYLNNVVCNNNVISSSATSEGGCLYIADHSGVFMVNNSEFANNVATSNGGGVEMDSSQGFIYFTNVIFNNNYAPALYGGGAFQITTFGNDLTFQPIASEAASIAFVNCTIINHVGPGPGPAAYVAGTVFVAASISFEGCLFANNVLNSLQSTAGGALTIDLGYHDVGGATYIFVDIGNCIFQNNTADSPGAAVYIDMEQGGDALRPYITIHDSQFLENSAASDGGAIIVNGLGQRNSGGKSGPLIIRNCIFNSNSAGGNGGAIRHDCLTSNCTTVINNCSFVNNTASSSGGAICITSSSVEAQTTGLPVTTITNSFFTLNSAGTAGAPNTAGAIIATQESNLNMFNLTIEQNSSPTALVFMSTAAAGGPSTVSVTDCVIVNNDAPIIYASGGAFTLTNVNISNNFTPTLNLIQIDKDSINFVNPILTQNTANSVIYQSGPSTISGSPGITINNNWVFTALISSSSGSMTWNNINIVNNSVTGSGSLGLIDISLSGSLIMLNGSRISNNIVSLGTGAISCQDDGSVSVSDTYIGFNSASQIVSISSNSYSQLSNIMFDSNTASSNIISVTGNPSEFSISSSTFINNIVTSGATAFSCGPGVSFDASNLNILNNIATQQGSAVISSCTLQMTQSTISNCTSGLFGGAFQLVGGSSTLDNVNMIGNSAISKGGAIFVNQAVRSSMSVSNSVIENNNANYAGALYADGDSKTTISFLNSSLSNNYASSFGGTMQLVSSVSVILGSGTTLLNSSASGYGGIAFLDDSSSLIINDATIGSSSASLGGCIYADKTSQLSSSNNAQFTQCTTSGNGGVVFANYKASVNFTSSAFTGNRANSSGGVIGVAGQGANQGVQVILTGNIFNNNTASRGGVLDFFQLENTDLTCLNNQFSNNFASIGGAIAEESFSLPSNLLGANTFTNNMATTFASDVFSQPANTSTVSTISARSGVSFNISVQIEDSFGNLYAANPVHPLTLQLAVSTSTPCLAGQQASSIIDGVANFNNLQLFAPPGQYSVSISPTAGSIANYPQYNSTPFFNTVIVQVPPCETGYFYGPNNGNCSTSCISYVCQYCSVASGYCVANGNCSCPVTLQGLGCDIDAGTADNITLTLPASVPYSIAERDTLLSQLQATLSSVYPSYIVTYLSYYQTNDGSVFTFAVQDNSTNSFLSEDQMAAITPIFANSSLIASLGATVAFTPIYRSFIAWSDAVAIAAVVFTALFIVVALIIFVIVNVNANTPVMRTSSPLFVQFIIFGLIAGYCTVFLYIGLPTDAQCAFQVILPPAAFGLVFGNLLAKTFRIWVIFGNERMDFVPPSNISLLLFSLFVVGIELLLSVIWLAVDRPRPVPLSAPELYWTCSSNSSTVQAGMTAAFYAFNGLLLVVGSFLAFVTRRVSSAFRESQIIGAIIYTISLFCLVMLPIIYVSTSLTLQFALRSFVVIFCISLALLAICGNKVYIILFHPERNDMNYLLTGKRNNNMALLNMGVNAKGSTSNTILSEKDEETSTVKQGYLVLKPLDTWFSNWSRRFVKVYPNLQGGLLILSAHENVNDETLVIFLHGSKITKVDDGSHHYFILRTSTGRRYAIDTPVGGDLAPWEAMFSLISSQSNSPDITAKPTSQ